MKFILAYGDSNTWGLIPGTSERFPWEIRWTGVLQKQCAGAQVIEEGLCGRTTAFEDALRPGRKGYASLPLILESHAPLDAAILMLGTNDCKPVYGAGAYAIGKGVGLCLDELERFLPAERILLVSPIELGDDVWQPGKDPEFSRDSVAICRELKAVYRRIAADRGAAFLAASDFAAADDADNEHLNREGHAAFAAAVRKKLKEMGVV